VRTEQGVGSRRLDPALDVVWERNGCPLNPANPPCLAIAQAAACAIDPTGAQCTADSDGDGCVDIAEVRLGLDAFDATDCLPDPSGRPAVNCLFPIGDRTCGRRDEGDRGTGGQGDRWLVLPVTLTPRAITLSPSFPRILLGPGSGDSCDE
jgi:hypothetical protein